MANMDDRRWIGKGAIGIYVFYADVFWMNEFLTESAVLMTACSFRKMSGRMWFVRVLGAAVLGSSVDTAVLLLSGSTVFYEASSVFAVYPLMVRLVLGWKGGKPFAADLALCLGIAMSLYAVLGIADARLGWGRVPVLAVVLCSLFANLMLHWLYGMYRLQRGLVSVHLCRGERRVDCQGLLDTGNLLQVVPGGEPVHIVSAEVFAGLGLSVDEAFSTVAYRSLGRSDGLLPVYRIDLLTADMDAREDVRMEGAVIACAGAGILDGRLYQVILNSQVSNNRSIEKSIERSRI